MLARDEFPDDLNFIVSWSVGNMIANWEHGLQKQYILDLGEEQVPVIHSNLVVHDWHNKVMSLEMNRFIVGRPNPIWLPIVPVGIEYSDAFLNGYNFD